MCSNVFVFYSADVFQPIGCSAGKWEDTLGWIHWVGYTMVDTLGRKCANRRLQRLPFASHWTLCDVHPRHPKHRCRWRGHWFWSVDHPKTIFFSTETNVNSLGFTINANAQSRPTNWYKIFHISDLVKPSSSIDQLPSKFVVGKHIKRRRRWKTLIMRITAM